MAYHRQAASYNQLATPTSRVDARAAGRKRLAECKSRVLYRCFLATRHWSESRVVGLNLAGRHTDTLRVKKKKITPPGWCQALEKFFSLGTKCPGKKKIQEKIPSSFNCSPRPSSPLPLSSPFSSPHRSLPSQPKFLQIFFHPKKNTLFKMSKTVFEGAIGIDLGMLPLTIGITIFNLQFFFIFLSSFIDTIANLLLGTTYSCVAVYRGQDVEISTLKNHRLPPSHHPRPHPLTSNSCQRSG